MTFFSRTTLILGLLVVVLSTSGLSCTLFPSQDEAAARRAATEPIVLNYWRVFDDEATVRPIIDAYTAQHRNVTINYRKLTFSEYEAQIVDALAEDRGPDIFSIPNTTIDRHMGKIEPMPQVMQVGALVETGTIRKTTTAVLQQIPGYTPGQIRDGFVSVVGEDVLRGTPGQEQVMGLPLAIDTMVLFYNRDLLDNAGIAEPPKTWSEFTSQVQRLTIADTSGNILQYGAALGSGRNVQRSGDILATLMMQNGARMTENGQPAFDRTPGDLASSGIQPAPDALRFYTDFAYPQRQTYTWNDDQPDSFEAFTQGRVAFFFGYSYHAQQLATTAPRLRVGVVPMPQIAPTGKQVTAANYWVEVVSKKTPHKDAAWDFLRFATSPEQATGYLERTQKPTALRSLIDAQTRLDAMRPYVQQALYATSWYHGRDPLGMEVAFVTMITDALGIRGGQADVERQRLMTIVQRAAQTIRATY